jgi:hypothetical protein
VPASAVIGKADAMVKSAPVVVHAVRYFPDGHTEETSLVGRAGEYHLWIPGTGGDRTERVLTGVDLADALAKCPEITLVSARDCLHIECADADIRGVLLDQLVEVDSKEGLDEELWPENSAEARAHSSEDDDINVAFEDVLQRRWLYVDGVRHSPLVVGDRAHYVPIVDGEIDPDEELVSAQWYGESAVISFDGNEVLGLIGDDLLLGVSRGDMPHCQIDLVTAGELPARIAEWLGGNNYAPAYLMEVSGTPGLTDAEAEALSTVASAGTRVQSVIPGGSAGLRRQVVESLRTFPTYRRFSDALLRPDSSDGQALYRRLRAIIAGDEELLELLVEYI